MPETPKPVMLVILDGWGEAPAGEDNAIHLANTPNWDRMRQQYPQTLIHTSGERVGLPDGQMGNSEVGHLNLGAGRIVPQEFGRISGAIEDGSFFSNPTLCEAVDSAVASGATVHVSGLLSPGGVHSHEEHLHAMVRLAVQRGAQRVRVHAILDGRDTPPRSAKASLERMETVLAEVPDGRIADIVGRYYAMDRDQRWDRIQKAYDLFTGEASDYEADSALEALEAAYERGENDEFVLPTRIRGGNGGMHDGDSFVFMNWRADRARQITRAFNDGDFEGFERKRHPRLSAFVCCTEYDAEFNVPVAFPPTQPKNCLGEYAAAHGLRQLRIAETEKYAHVTFFFNGGREQPFEGEDRVLVPSPDVATYDLQPEMSAPEVTERLEQAIGSGDYELIIANYANPDMVGHTGDLDAAIQAVECIDQVLGRLEMAVQDAGGAMLVTADHGNSEKMRDAETGQAHTAHTTNLVPLVHVGPAGLAFDGDGALADIAPTLLGLLGLEAPAEMTGRNLLVPADRKAAAGD